MHLSLGRDERKRSPFATKMNYLPRRSCDARAWSARVNHAGRKPFHWYKNSWRRSQRSFRVAAVGFNAPCGPPFLIETSSGHPGNQFRRWEIASVPLFLPVHTRGCNQTQVAIGTSVVVHPIIWLAILTQGTRTEKILLPWQRHTCGTLFRYISDYLLFKRDLFNLRRLMKATLISQSALTKYNLIFYIELQSTKITLLSKIWILKCKH